jgi:hypothetical protein
MYCGIDRAAWVEPPSPMSYPFTSFIHGEDRGCLTVLFIVTDNRCRIVYLDIVLRFLYATNRTTAFSPAWPCVSGGRRRGGLQHHTGREVRAGDRRLRHSEQVHQVAQVNVVLLVLLVLLHNGESWGGGLIHGNYGTPANVKK